MATSEKIYAFPFSSLCRRVRQGLDIVAREKISCVQCQQSQIGTRSLCQGRDLYFLGPLGQIGNISFRQGGNISSLGPVESDKDYIFFYREKISCLKGRQIHIGTRYRCQGRDIISRVGKVRQGLDLCAREENSSLYGRKISSLGRTFFFCLQGMQSKIGTTYLCLGGEFFSKRPVQSDSYQISLLKSNNHISTATREKIHAFPFSSQCRILHIPKGTRSLLQGRNLVCLWSLTSERDYIFVLGR